MKDILYFYILVNLLIYGSSVGIVYEKLDNETFECNSEASASWEDGVAGLAFFLVSHTPAFVEDVKEYCETHAESQL